MVLPSVYVILPPWCCPDEDPGSIEIVEEDEEDVECSPKKLRTAKGDKVSGLKEPESAGCNKNPIVSVVLAAHEAIPGEILYGYYNQLIYELI